MDKTIAKSPAEAAGLRSGDRLIRIGNQTVQSFFELKDAVQKSGETEGKVTLSWEKSGRLDAAKRIETAVIIPTKTTTRDPILNTVNQFTVGVVPLNRWRSLQLLLSGYGIHSNWSTRQLIG